MKPVALSSNPYSCAIDDYNANIRSDSSRFGQKLIQFCVDESLIISDKVLASDDSFTFVSDAHAGSVAWLDHVISTRSMHSLIDSFWIDYSYVSSDHLPLCMKLNINKVNLAPRDSSSHAQSYLLSPVRWDSFSEEMLEQYKKNVFHNLSKVRLNHSLLLCDNPMCEDPGHRSEIDCMFNSILDSLSLASVEFRGKLTTPFKQIAGWSEICDELHSSARSAFMLWANAGKPRYGELFHIMRTARAHFKQALRQCKADKSRHSSDKLANKFLRQDKRPFWKEIKKITEQDQINVQAETIEGHHGAEAITKMWQDHYTALLNSSPPSAVDLKAFVIEEEYDPFTPEDVCSAVKSLKNGKSQGLDGIYAEHLKYAVDTLPVLLSMVFNSMLIHGHLPSKLMDTKISPIVKDKKGDLSSADNYRPIAVTCILSKVFELMILDRHKHALDTTANQFGYKPKHGTEFCIFVAKQVIDYYKRNGSPLCLCFLDLSKDFDKVDHNLLITKLMSRKVPSIIIRILQTWYATQSFIVQWGNCWSAPFTVTNGVRQGGILSPYLFNVFVDDLSHVLRNSCHGCYVNGECFNHVVYADDTLLPAPSPTALQNLIDICCHYFTSHRLVINYKKCKCVAVCPKSLRDLCIPKLFVNGSVLRNVEQEMYLGFIMTSRNGESDTISKETRALYARGNMLLSKFRHCTQDVKKNLFMTYCSSLYCCSMWSVYDNSTLRSIHVAHNDVLRVMFHLPRHTRVSNIFVKQNIPSFPVLRRKLVYSMYKRVLTSSNSLVQTLVNSNFFVSSKIFKKWMEILF